MRTLVMCEGKTDAVLMSYLLTNVSEWIPVRSRKFPHQISYEEKFGEYIYWYKKDERYLMIASVGGKDNFGSFYNGKIKQIQVNEVTDKLFTNVICVIDRDNETTEQIINNLKDQTGLNFKNDEWVKNAFNNNFKQEVEINVGSIIIPNNKSGALEKVLINGMAEMNHESLINDAKMYVEKCKETGNYLKKARDTPKAHLGSVFAILSPEKVFSFIDEIINDINWEESQEVIAQYKLLVDL